MRTLVICALATALVGCSSQPSIQQPSCAGLNPLACITAVDVPIEPASDDAGSAPARPVSKAARRDEGPAGSHADHSVRRKPTPTKVTKAAPAVPLPRPSPQPNQQTTGNAGASAGRTGAADPPSTGDVAQVRATEQQVAAAAAVAERMSVPTPETSLAGLTAIVVTGPDVTSVPDLAGKTIAIDDRYSETSISRIGTAIAGAGASAVELSRSQTSAIGRLVGKQVPAAVVGLVSVSAADHFPEIAGLRTFRVPLTALSANK